MRLTQTKLARLRRGMLAVTLAQRTGIRGPRLSLIENGHVNPKADELERIALALGVSVVELGLTAHGEAA